MTEPNIVNDSGVTDNGGQSDHVYWDDDDGSCNLESEFSEISINYCTDLLSAADSPCDFPKRTPNLNSARLLPLQNILKTDRLARFVKDVMVSDDKQKYRSNKIQLGFLINEFEKKLEVPKELIDIFTALYEICVDSENVTNFVQLRGHTLLFEYLRRYTTARVPPLLNCKFAQIFKDFAKDAFTHAIVLLVRLSYFTAFRIAVQKENYVDILLEIFNPVNGYFIDESFSDQSQESQLMNLKKVAKENRVMLLKRAMPASTADYGPSVYMIQNKLGDKPDLPVFDNSEKMHVFPFNVSIVQNLYKSKTGDPKRKRIECTQVIDPTSFWAIRRKDLDVAVNNLNALLADSSTDLCDFKPKLYQMVLIPAIIDKVKALTSIVVTLNRAVILHLDKPASNALLFCVDFGYYDYLPVKCLKALPKGADKIEAAAFMCVLENFVSYPSTEFSIFVTALSNLCHDTFFAEILARHEIFWIICSNVLGSTDFHNIDVFQDISDLLLTLSNFGRVQTKMIELNFHEMLLNLVLKTIDKVDKEEALNFLSTNLSTVSNLALMNVTVRKFLSENKAIAVPQGLIAHFPEVHPIIHICEVFLKNILTKKACTEAWYNELDLMCCRNCYLSKETIPLKQPVELANYEEDLTTMFDNAVEKFIASNDSAKKFSMLMNRSLISHTIPGITKTTEKLLENLPQDYPFYVAGQPFVPKVVGNFETPIWEVVSEESDFEMLRSPYVQSYACAALNSKTKLVLYFGFSTPSDKNKRVAEVAGIRLNFNQRDNFRINTDFALSKAFRPILQPELYDVRIVPVFSKRKVKGECVFEKTDLFVVEVHITNLSDQDKRGTVVSVAFMCSINQMFPQKDVILRNDACSTLLLDKHSKFIHSYEEKKNEYEYVMAEYLRMSGVYWCLTAMDLMGKLDEMNKKDILNFVMACRCSNGGFAASQNHDSHLLHTLSAVQILILIDALDSVDIDSIVSFVKSLQNEDGSFCGDEFGEIDTRYSFCAVACLSLLNRLDALDIDRIVEYVMKCKNFDGGFGVRVDSESHAGQIYCCLGVLSLTGYLNRVDADQLGFWLCERQCQSGGLNGNVKCAGDALRLINK